MQRPNLSARVGFTAIAAVAALLGGIGFAAASGSDDPPSLDDRLPRQSVEVGADISGPCDEAEHANDPRCVGVVTVPPTPPSAPTTGAPTTAPTVAPTTAAPSVDISGPCDEAEHANDPRCTGVVIPSTPSTTVAAGGVDISGPCDEAEHANDPRCTGAAGERDDDRGRGHDDDDRDDDRSGSHHGGDDHDDDRSGHGHGGDDRDDD